MKLPPKHRRWSRVWYRIANVFAPDLFRCCEVLNADQRIAALLIRRGHHTARQTGRDHEVLLGQYNACEHIRKSNVQKVWDEMSSRIARVPKKPMLPG